MAIRPHTFPPYVFQEFPKWVTKPDGTGVVAHNAAEEAEALGEPVTRLVPPSTLMTSVGEVEIIPAKRGPGRPRKIED